VPTARMQAHAHDAARPARTPAPIARMVTGGTASAQGTQTRPAIISQSRTHARRQSARPGQEETHDLS